MTVAIITGFVVTIVTYYLTIFFGKPHRMSGNTLYDIFMGATLNPRILNLDLKVPPLFFLFCLSLFFHKPNTLYDIFLGATLNPRNLNFDLKASSSFPSPSSLYLLTHSRIDLGRNPRAMGHSFLRQCLRRHQAIRATRLRFHSPHFHVPRSLALR